MSAILDQLVDVRRDISAFRAWSNDDLYALASDQVAELQHQWLRRRFTELRPGVRVLDRLATELGIEGIDDINEASVLCLPHTAFKAYTVGDVEKRRFARLTKWLDSLTVHDLSDVDVTGAESLQGWLIALEQQTPLRPHVSSGSSGKVSIYPKSRIEGVHLMEGLLRAMAAYGDEPGLDMLSGRYPFITPWPAATGHHHLTRTLELLRSDVFPGREEMVITYGDADLSADELWLAGKIRRAEARGEELALSDAEQQLRDEVVARARAAAAEDPMGRFIERSVRQLEAQQVGILSVVTRLVDFAQACRDRGVQPDYDPRSVVLLGGGNKGQALPDGWEELVADVVGVPVVEAYGMSESSAMARQCRFGRYHPPPWGISWVLDPQTSEPFPRAGVQTGRHACFDLLSESYWSGTISGDEVTVNWDGGCECGRRGHYFAKSIRRYGESEGGDDKISCARTPDAYQNVIDLALGGEV